MHTTYLKLLGSTVLFYSTLADLNPNGNHNDSFVDILSDASCPNLHSGRLSIDNCLGYVDCMNGFEIDRAICQEGMLYSMRSENCEPKESVHTEPCIHGVIDNPGSGRFSGPKPCGDGLCVTPDGNCGVMHTCLINPCEMTSCGENEVCEASYCGGCHATCTLKLQAIDQIMDDSDIIMEAPLPTTKISPTKPASTTTNPMLIDEEDAWVPNDGVAPWSTKVTPETNEENVVVGPTPADTDSSQVYIPSWVDHTCVAETNEKKNKSRRLGSRWHSSYTSQYECCVNNFIYSLELFEACIGFDLNVLESHSDGDADFYPVWKDGHCKITDGSEDGWLQTTFRPKKYLCCFEYFKWDFDNCLIT